MFILIKLINQLLTILASERPISDLTKGLILGLFLALIPYNFLFLICLLILNFIIKGSFRMLFLSMFIFTLPAFLLDIPADKLGLALLTWPALHKFWAFIFNLPLVSLLDFNNSVNLGQLMFALILSIPTYRYAKKGISNYREKLLPKLKSSKLYKSIKASKFIVWVNRIRGLVT
eukprot:COSAG01_NODE_2503_length_7555_cov_3.547881_1_plen_175_part_00